MSTHKKKNHGDSDGGYGLDYLISAWVTESSRGCTIEEKSSFTLGLKDYKI